MVVSGRYRDPSIVRPWDVPLTGGFVRAVPPPRPTRLHRGMLNKIWWQLNSVKIMIFLFRCGISRVGSLGNQMVTICLGALVVRSHTLE